MELIDRATVYEDMMYEMCGTGFQANALSVISRQQEIEAMPIVYGKIKKRKSGEPYCSICGANQHESYDAAIEECKYCYSCGAKFDMEE